MCTRLLTVHTFRAVSCSELLRAYLKLFIISAWTDYATYCPNCAEVMEDFNILVIQTGGTIDKDYPKRKGGYAFEICGSGAMTVLDKVRPSFPYRLVTACREDSQDLTDQHRSGIAQICKEAEETFLLITHGTDTILQTAAFLAKRLFGQNTVAPISMTNQSETPPGKADLSGNATLSSCHQSESRSSNSSQSATEFQGVSGEATGNESTMVNSFHKLIFITGAFLPERFKDTDADFNIGVVLGAMQVGLPPGVYVSLGGRVWHWDKVTRASDGQYVSL